MTGLSRGGWRILARTAQAAPAQTRGGLRARRPATSDDGGSLEPSRPSHASDARGGVNKIVSYCTGV